MSSQGHSNYASQAPWRQVIKRLVKNKLAVAGLIGVLLVSGSAVFLPIFFNIDATTLRPWVGVTAPGSSHPEVLGENIFALGEMAEIPPSLLKYNTLNIQSKKKHSQEYRIVLKRRKVYSITLNEGGVKLSQLDLRDKKLEAVELLENNQLGETKSGFLLKTSKPAPLGAFAPGQRVLILRVSKDSEKVVRYEIKLSEGKVHSILSNSVTQNKVTIRAEDITQITSGGQELLRHHLLGTDDHGRDLFARLLFGIRISLMVGCVATLVSIFIGVLYGATSAYLGGRWDQAMMAFVDILYSIPFMFLVILLVSLYGRNLFMFFIALGAVQWLTMARIVRGQVLSLKEKEFVEAALSGGASTWGIITRHLIPNTLGTIIVYTTLTIPLIILEESFLAFIGLSIQYQGQNLDSLGSLVHQGILAMGDSGSRYWLLIYPSLVMVVTLLGLNTFGDGLRDALDPQLKNRS